MAPAHPDFHIAEADSSSPYFPRSNSVPKSNTAEWKATRSVVDVTEGTPFNYDVILLDTGAVPTVFGLTNENLL